MIFMFLYSGRESYFEKDPTVILNNKSILKMVEAKLSMVVLQFLFLAQRYIASISTSLHQHVICLPGATLALGSNSLPWFSVSLVFYLGVCYLDLAVPCISSKSDQQLVVRVRQYHNRISICRFHSLGMVAATCHIRLFQKDLNRESWGYTFLKKLL